MRAANDLGVRPLDPGNLARTEPTSQPRSRGRGNAWNRGQRRRQVGALPVQGDQHIPAQQLRLRHRDQQLPGRALGVPPLRFLIGSTDNGGRYLPLVPPSHRYRGPHPRGQVWRLFKLDRARRACVVTR